ncbi:MAG: lipid IV(A) 3-deoxy-D-manno-octulosonic acid transferase [Proteobacteria bacterium]|nr:lipid IV(A) 3-deoxy-D-manno-octulosonic acid transferase [Pseudomonadota bacterium]
MRFVYAILTYLLLPVYACYWFFRGLGNRTYWDRFGQRFGFCYPRLFEGCIWVHAVSVGEVQASLPLVNALTERFPNRHVLITTVTPTGAARVRLLFGDSVVHCYVPFETPFAVSSFFNAIEPELALIMETEIWPNLFNECGRRQIPLVLVSARISPKSANSYRKFLQLFKETLSHGIVIAAQSETDAERFRSLGAAPERTWVTGNIKFDIEIAEGLPQQGTTLRRDNFDDRPVWVAASTHDREERMVLHAHRLVQKRYPNAMLVLVPRHPERFATVRTYLHKEGFRAVSRTDGLPCTPDTEVLLVDTMGELPLFYAAADVAFVGGTLFPIGGHNLLEPAALGRPVITGPYLFNTQDIANMFERLGASVTVNNAGQLGIAVADLFGDPQMSKDIGSRGLEIVRQNRGSLDRLLTLLEPLVRNAD